MNTVLSTRLKELRMKKEKLQKDVAEYLEITTSAYGYYENGLRQPSPDVLLKLAEYFDVSIDYLLGRSNISNTICEPIAIAASTKDNIDLSEIEEEDKKIILNIYHMIKEKKKKNT